jgi:hypothetical protein
MNSLQLQDCLTVYTSNYQIFKNILDNHVSNKYNLNKSQSIEKVAFLKILLLFSIKLIPKPRELQQKPSYIHRWERDASYEDNERITEIFMVFDMLREKMAKLRERAGLFLDQLNFD